MWVITAMLVQGMIESDGCGCAFLPLYQEKAVAVQQWVGWFFFVCVLIASIFGKEISASEDALLPT